MENSWEEMLDCVDADNRPVDPQPRFLCHGNPALTHRVVHLIVVDGSGRILAQRRSLTKDIQPGKWDTSVGGHLTPGEDVADAARRECMEEIGIIPETMTLLHSYLWVSDMESEDVTTWLVCSNGPFTHDPLEIDQLAFFDPATLTQMAVEGKLTPNFRFELALYRDWCAGVSPSAYRYPIQQIIECRACPRLSAFRESVKPAPRHALERYWNRPVPGFGDLRARVVIVGLAPGAHGANRSGRPFTGDFAGDVLYRSLHALGLSSHASPVKRGDGLNLTDVFITNAVKCVPPDNRPLPDEMTRCSQWLQSEFAALSNVKVILTLGALAFKTVFRMLNPGIRGSHVFHHAEVYQLEHGLPVIVACYHPSRRNINTGIVTQAEIDRVVALAYHLAK